MWIFIIYVKVNNYGLYDDNFIKIRLNLHEILKAELLL